MSHDRHEHDYMECCECGSPLHCCCDCPMFGGPKNPTAHEALEMLSKLQQEVCA